MVDEKKIKKPIIPTRKDRFEREQAINRYVTIGFIGVIASIVISIGFGVFFENYLKPDQPIATVDGTVITTRDFQSRAKFERRPLVDRFGQLAGFLQNLSADQTEFIQQIQSQMLEIQTQLDPIPFGEMILNRMIDEIVLRDEAERMGITVSDEEVEVLMASGFNFFPNGTPTSSSTPQLKSTSTLSATQLSIVGTSPAFTPTAIIPTIEQIGTSSPFTLTPSSSGTPLEDENGSQVDSDPTATPEGTEAPSLPTLTPTVYTTEIYGEVLRNQTQFYDEEYRFSPEAFRNLLILQEYADKLFEIITADVLQEADQVWIRHILSETEEDSLDLLSQLEDGEDWDALAEEFSADPSTSNTGGDIGWLLHDLEDPTLTEEFLDLAFTTPIGEIVGPVETPAGWHLIRVVGHEIRELSPARFEFERQRFFTNAVAEIRDNAEIIIEDYWSNRAPIEPDVPRQSSAAPPPPIDQ